MNDINEMPPKCQYCPYWEVCKYPWVCPDIGDKKSDLQPTCNQLATDRISRQAAIDAVKKNTFRLTFAEEQNCEGHVAWSAEAVYSDVMEGALLDLPSAQPEQRWIPCSERLPENGYWLWSAKGGEVQKDFYWDGHWEQAEKYGYDVMAWLPIPKPYKENDHD